MLQIVADKWPIDCQTVEWRHGRTAVPPAANGQGRRRVHLEIGAAFGLALRGSPGGAC
ncbi:hypothetical protein [Burkholderia sp. SCN-KJ]|uniref:hypothetical protein n=1 Tax=Burkholderia sp. SCN-KJ TaxID=2969248 RepID=UPI0021500D09|nr:hypothetical protein [Burkholderia sp. SCN-KJ]MCR4471656.1 hypothetical protein [Burkholderia sp. SCN-KJ]